jgi:hypothetical protein
MVWHAASRSRKQRQEHGPKLSGQVKIRKLFVCSTECHIDRSELQKAPGVCRHVTYHAGKSDEYKHKKTAPLVS